MSSPPAPAVNAKAPAIKKGWLKKQGRSGMIKNWKTRYFVISQGMLNYYQEKSDDFPFGEGLKVTNRPTICQHEIIAILVYT